MNHSLFVLVICVCFSCHKRVKVIVRITAGSGVNYNWLEGKSSAFAQGIFFLFFLLDSWVNGVRDPVVFFLHCLFILAWQLESPWQRFYLTHMHSHPEVSVCSCMDACIDFICQWVSTMGLCSCPLFIFTSTLSFPLPLCRFCTAAADRKLRLLTSDLQDKHEVKVAQYLEHTSQKSVSQLASSFL